MNMKFSFMKILTFFANVTIRLVQEIFYVLVFQNTYVEDGIFSLLNIYSLAQFSSVSLVESRYGPEEGRVFTYRNL
jgi:ABC-type uncharacterized transport system permease subunit